MITGAKENYMPHYIIYRQLQRHLDRQPVGFPRDRSGADIRLLKHHFSAEEALIALAMSYRFERIEVIIDRLTGVIKKIKALSSEAIPDALTPAEIRQHLNSMSSRTTIMQKERKGILYYCLVPLVIGMYEGRIFDLDMDYIDAFNDYAHSMQHGLSLISTGVPQMRTIPIEASITAVHDIMRYDDVKEHINNSDGPIFIVECICRKQSSMMGEPCKKTQRTETCMVFGDLAKQLLKFSKGREVSRDEALEIIRENQKEGLVLQAYNMQNPEVICSCCGCCCGMLSVQKMLPNPRVFTTSSYHAVIDPQKCIGCRLCEKKCQVDALTFNKKQKKVSVVDKRCIGCGICIPVCRAGALTLVRHSDAPVPPGDFEALQDAIMKKKPFWRLGRIIGRTVTK